MREVGVHKTFHKGAVSGRPVEPDEEKANIRRTKGIFATNEYRRSELPDLSTI